MELSLEKLKELGSFSGAPVKRDITWKQGGEDLTATVWVRRMGYQEAKADIDQHHKKSGEVNDAMAVRIASCILGEDGKPIFTPEIITGEDDPERGPLCFNLTMALLAEIGKVNNLGKVTSSQTKPSSGTS